MTTKAKKKPETKTAASPKTSKPSAKVSTQGKISAKSDKKSEVLAEKSEAELAIPVIDEDEAEEAAAAAQSRSTDSNAAALAAAAASGTPEMSASFKNFRHHPDMENFYRFIFENDLRFEALAILDEMTQQRMNLKQVKGAKKVAH